MLEPDIYITRWLYDQRREEDMLVDGSTDVRSNGMLRCVKCLAMGNFAMDMAIIWSS